MNEKSLPERMREIALDIPDDMTNREYWLRTEIVQWADEIDVDLKAIEAAKLSDSLRAMGLGGGSMTDKTAAQAFRDLKDTLPDVVGPILSLLTIFITLLNRFLKKATRAGEEEA